MNIHPIFVHFPIALLTLYSALELVRFKKFLALDWLFFCKAVLVIAGELGAFVTLQTGELAAEQYRGSSVMSLVETHSNWATATTIIFGIVAASYLVKWLGRWARAANYLSTTVWSKALWKLLNTLAHLAIETPLVIILALAGLVGITVTGALGGALVYGTDVDPVVSFVTKLLVK